MAAPCYATTNLRRKACADRRLLGCGCVPALSACFAGVAQAICLWRNVVRHVFTGVEHEKIALLDDDLDGLTHATDDSRWVLPAQLVPPRLQPRTHCHSHVLLLSRPHPPHLRAKQSTATCVIMA